MPAPRLPRSAAVQLATPTLAAMLDPTHPDSLPPSLGRLLGEVGVIGDWLRAKTRRVPAGDPARGRGRRVLVIPGFMIDDTRTLTLRRALRAAGYDAHGWGLGRNLGATADILDRLVTRVTALGGGPVTLVGWSLGGIYARELATFRPDLVERVVTMGSPFSGDPRANNAWRMYERVSGHKVDAPPIARSLLAKPPVRTIALWSRRDGIVAPASARGLAAESDLRVEVDCVHTGFALSHRAIAAVLDALDA